MVWTASYKSASTKTQIMVIPGLELVAIGAAFLAALFFGMEGVLGKRGIEAGGNAILASLIVAIVSMVLFGGVAVGTTSLTTVSSWSLSSVGIFFVGGVFGSGFGVLAIYQGIDRVGASINTAVVNGRPLFAALFGFLFLSESLRFITLGGIGVLVIGLVFIALSKGGDIRGWETRELMFPFGASVLLSLANVMRRYGLTRTEIELFEGIAINAAGGLFVLVSYVVLTNRKELLFAPRRAYGWLIITSTITALALFSLFFALEREMVAIVDSIAATAPLFTLVLSWLFLRDVERITVPLMTGVSLVVLGTILIVSL